MFGKGCYQRGPRFLPAALSVSRSPVVGERNPAPPPHSSCSFLTTEVNMKIRLFLISLITSSAMLCAADKSAGAEMFNQMRWLPRLGRQVQDRHGQAGARCRPHLGARPETDGFIARPRRRKRKRENAGFPGQTEQRRNQSGRRLCSATSQAVNMRRRGIILLFPPL